MKPGPRKPRKGFAKGGKGAGPSSWSTSKGKATNAFKKPRKLRKRKGFTHG